MSSKQVMVIMCLYTFVPLIRWILVGPLKVLLYRLKFHLNFVVIQGCITFEARISTNNEP